MTIKKWKTYTAYSIGCGMVWAIVWIAVVIAGSGRSDSLLLVFAGWVIGWTSATIGRAIYPPPKSN